MPMVLYAGQADVEARLGRELTSDEAGRVEGLLVEATLLVGGHLGVTYPTVEAVPDAVRVVVARVAARALTQAASGREGVEQSTVQAGPFQVQHRYGEASASGGVWLSKADLAMLTGLGARQGMVSISTITDHA